RPGPEFWYVPHGADAPTVEASVDVRGPGLVTAWGRRLVFVDAEDSRSIEVLTADTGETVGRVELGGELSALAASPSSHELYAGIETPPGIVAVNRFSFTHRLLANLDRPPVEIRPSLFGEYLLVHDGERTWRLDSENGDMSPIPGDWGPDLPLGLPNGLVLVRTEGGVSQVNAAGQIEGDPIADQDETAWLPVQWTPVARGLSDEIEGIPLAVSPGRPAPAPSESVPSGPEMAPPTPPDVAPGYYAIVGSARQRAGIEALVAELSDAGFPVEVQSIADVAGENWYRGLVGPYATRAEAEAAARQLQRERQLQSWVTGINADS
ncbi:MAG: SPOR domain-containing protein, partial [Gemmatimonadota bacterium]